ncbi:MAG: hypothetical protein GEU91_20495 [Rhizobiales bacterium]|nr:hypothetical protein [Hyphomicrobiales bacterium]
MADFAAQPHYPASALIEAYGAGGFRFAGMSHRGSLLFMPDGIWAWPVRSPDGLSQDALAPVFARAPELDLVLVGTGRDPWIMPNALHERFRALRLTVDTMTTGAAVRTYNVLLAERRRIAAALIAVD